MNFGEKTDLSLIISAFRSMLVNSECPVWLSSHLGLRTASLDCIGW